MIALGSTGCIQDTDCGICDPDNLILESISGVNYQSNKVHILNPECEGDNCPAPISKGTYFIEDVIPCEETEEAQESANAEEYCKLSPLVTAFGIEFVFNNLLDPTSIELVRKRPDNPQLFEVYDWKTDVLQVQGPITRFNGDFHKGEREQADTISRLVNLSCIDNITENGGTFGAADYADPSMNPCNAINPTTGLPMKLAEEGTIKAARGIWTASGNSCSSPEEGPDTCCSYCDYLLSTKVERYGVDADGTALNPNLGTAIQCGTADPEATLPIDKYATCSGFIPDVDRSDEEQSWEYAWCSPGTSGADCPLEVQVFKVPLFDKLRETHPDQRPAGLENRDAKCSNTGQCGSVHDLPGTECIGTHTGTGEACLADAYDDGSCTEAVCRPEWMVRCVFDEDTTGTENAYCQDRRFGTSGTAACHFATTNTPVIDCDEEGENCATRGRSRDDRPAAALAYADWDENGIVSNDEACQEGLGYGSAITVDGVVQCDPFYQQNLFQASIYDRDENLPAQARACICPSNNTLQGYINAVEGTDEEICIETVSAGCYDSNDELVDGRAGQYATKFVSRLGGIVYDPAVKGFDWRPADLGGIPRADVESCAENRSDTQLDELNRHDGWRAADAFTPENFEDYDRAMCSGQEYTVVFNEPGNGDNPAYVIDKADNTLAGKSVYKFETAQFHVQPDSGFPTDNLRIGACDDFSLRFSNKYDASPENLAKLQLFRVTCTGSGEDQECTMTAPDPRCDLDDPPAGACCDLAPVAGGPSCAETEAELQELLEGNACAAPCLTIDIENQFIGEVSVQVDPIEFGQYLEVNETYRMFAPMANNYSEAAGDDAIYKAVFWDACGMPLVADKAESYAYDFTIDTPKCKEDPDKDGIPLSCDNADTAFNPNQDDIDNDGVGDVIDLCPMAGGDANNTADSDNDGIGNECDSCRQTLTQYNEDASAASVPDYMMVRNIPDQTDTDEDGIGDVCDNCVVTANCEDFGAENPHEVASPIAFDNNDLCQGDDNSSMVGDACEGAMGENAAGPVGFADQDDFDQDGLINSVDGCPRQPLRPEERIECTMETAEADCGPGRPCTLAGFCNHLDSDNDGVGNICDTCAFVANPGQTMDGGSQEDDPDGDFVGEVCEIGADKGCGDRKNARPFGFFPIQAAGNCCTTQLIEADEAAVASAAADGRVLSVGDLLIAGTCQAPAEGEPVDLATCTPLTGTPFSGTGSLERGPDGEFILSIPIRRAANCTEVQEENFECFALPADVENAQGVVNPPEGCEAALADAGVTALDNLLAPLTPENFANESNPFDALWQNMCFLPQRDQDYDGIGDACEFQDCQFAFDPTGKPYVDANGRLWPNDGAACQGELAIDNLCELEDEQSGETGEDTEGDEGGSSGGDEGGSSGG